VSNVISEIGVKSRSPNSDPPNHGMEDGVIDVMLINGSADEE